jgi:DNA-binding NtrC family response regulator
MAVVLVASADADLRSQLRRALQREGHTVMGADDGRAALNTLVASSRPLVAVIDEHLPIFDGMQLLGYLRLLAPDAPHHRAVLLADDLHLARALVEAGHQPAQVRLIRRPFAMESLLDAIESAAARAPAGDLRGGRDGDGASPRRGAGPRLPRLPRLR